MHHCIHKPTYKVENATSQSLIHVPWTVSVIDVRISYSAVLAATHSYFPSSEASTEPIDRAPDSSWRCHVTTTPSLYHVIIGVGNPLAEQGSTNNFVSAIVTSVGWLVNVGRTRAIQYYEKAQKTTEKLWIDQSPTTSEVVRLKGLERDKDKFNGHWTPIWALTRQRVVFDKVEKPKHVARAIERIVICISVE